MHSSGAPPGSAAGTASPSSSIRGSGTTCAAGMRRNTSVLPSAGEWTVVLDTDAIDFHGDGWREQTGQSEVVTAHEGQWQGQPAHVTVNVPALTTLWLQPNPDTTGTH